MGSPYITKTINYGWNTLREYYSIKCCKCGSYSDRAISRGCNSLASPEYISNLYRELADDAKRLSQQEDFICTKCLSKSCDTDFNFSEDVTQNKNYIEARQIIEDISQRNAQLYLENKLLNDLYKDRIVKYNNAFWVVYYVYCECGDKWREPKIYLNMTKLHAKRIWEKTNIDSNANIEDVEISDKYFNDIQPKKD